MTTSSFSVGPNYACEWILTLADIREDEWNACFSPDDVLNSYALTDALYHSQFAGTVFYYLVGRKTGGSNMPADARGSIAFIIPCFTYSANFDVLAPGWFTRVAEKVRSVFCSFLSMRVFFIGSPIATSADSLGFALLEVDERLKVLSYLRSELKKKGGELGAQLIVLKEIPEAKLSFITSALKSDFLFVPSHPTARLLLEPTPDRSYASRLRNHYSSVLRRRKKLLDVSGITLTIETGFQEKAEEIYQLYRAVFEKSDAQFLGLTVEFFRQVAQRLPDDAAIVTAKKDERIVGFVLLFYCGSELVPLYLGLDYGARDDAALYYNLLYRIFEEGEKRGAKEVLLGQTAEESKALLGANFEQLSLAICPLTAMTKLVLKVFSKTLFPKIETPKRNVFRE